MLLLMQSDAVGPNQNQLRIHLMISPKSAQNSRDDITLREYLPVMVVSDNIGKKASRSLSSVRFTMSFKP
jgi:hypothetical protein